MRLTIRAKIILTVSLSLIAIFALIMFLLVRLNVGQLRTNLNQSSKSYASLATPPIGATFVLYQDSGRLRITQQVNKFMALDPDVTAIKIVSVDGKPLYDSSGRSQPISDNLAESFQARYIANKDGYTKEVVEPYFEDSGAHRYSVVYEISTKRVQQGVASVVRLILYVGVAILLVSIAATFWAFNTLFIRPLRSVSHSADVVSAGNYNQQIIAKNKDEIGSLAQAVNRMAEALKADISKLQEVDKLKSEFMMIASHNLRTPLTIMRGYIEMAGIAQTVPELKSAVNGIQDGVVRLHLLSEDLLTISSLEAGGEKMEKTPVAARQFIDSVAKEFEVLAEKKRLDWRFVNNLPDDLKFNISQSNMRSALGNVIDNAIKFTKENGAVRVAAKLEGGRLVFSVTDTGIGIREEEIPRLFTKFHRGTSTLTYDYEGAGIGLYLTKLIVGEHGGQISVQSQVGHGSTFSVYLPLALPVPGGHPPAA
ncbi:MAG TPA: HAMP domain-containing sensor histidine kinase [Candidatus Saccharimonadales bacterium]|nr:HAMP domain-containing sensor histidine kinase [Candidatus Saccharimonadales bacterium]